MRELCAVAAVVIQAFSLPRRSQLRVPSPTRRLLASASPCSQMVGRFSSGTYAVCPRGDAFKLLVVTLCSWWFTPRHLISQRSGRISLPPQNDQLRIAVSGYNRGSYCLFTCPRTSQFIKRRNEGTVTKNAASNV